MGPRVPRKTNTIADLALKKPILIAEEQSQVNDVTMWSRTHEKLMYLDWRALILRLSEFVYDVDASSVPRPVAGTTRLLVDQSPPAVNTRGATPRKEQAQATDKGKLKKVDMGKGKMIEPEKPKELALRTGGAFKIYEPQAHVPSKPPLIQSPKKSPIPKKKMVEAPSRVARLLKLVDEEEDSEVPQPLNTILGPVPTTPTPSEESNVEVIEAPLAKKRKLTKGVAAVAPEVESNRMASFLAIRRKQESKPDVPDVTKVEAFLANKLVEVSPVNTVGPILEEPLQVIGDPIPVLDLDHPLGSNIQHILEDLNLESEDSVGMQSENFGHLAPTKRLIALPLSLCLQFQRKGPLLECRPLTENEPDFSRGRSSLRVEKALDIQDIRVQELRRGSCRRGKLVGQGETGQTRR